MFHGPAHVAGGGLQGLAALSAPADHRLGAPVPVLVSDVAQLVVVVDLHMALTGVSLVPQEHSQMI